MGRNTRYFDAYNKVTDRKSWGCFVSNHKLNKSIQVIQNDGEYAVITSEELKKPVWAGDEAAGSLKIRMWDLFPEKCKSKKLFAKTAVRAWFLQKHFCLPFTMSGRIPCPRFKPLLTKYEIKLSCSVSICDREAFFSYISESPNDKNYVHRIVKDKQGEFELLIRRMLHEKEISDELLDLYPEKVEPLAKAYLASLLSDMGLRVDKVRIHVVYLDRHEDVLRKQKEVFLKAIGSKKEEEKDSSKEAERGANAGQVLVQICSGTDRCLCGYELRKSDRFCPGCGKRLKDERAE